MTTRSSQPVALTIAGSDSGGGAGVQVDLKTFAAFRVHGTSAITCLTAQNPRAVLEIHPTPPGFLRQQLEALFAELPPSAVKTGMLFSRANIRVAIDWFRAPGRPPLVVDPVMVASSGARLLRPAAIKALIEGLLPLARLVTPNLDEAQILVGRPLRSIEDLRSAAREIHQAYGCAALVKGGHLRQMREAVDIFYDGREELLLTAPFVRGVTTHGTGCTYSAAITACLAMGHPLNKSVRRAKEHITGAIAHSIRIGRHSTLDAFWRR